MPSKQSIFRHALRCFFLLTYVASSPTIPCCSSSHSVLSHARGHLHPRGNCVSCHSMPDDDPLPWSSIGSTSNPGPTGNPRSQQSTGEPRPPAIEPITDTEHFVSTSQSMSGPSLGRGSMYVDGDWLGVNNYRLPSGTSKLSRTPYIGPPAYHTRPGARYPSQLTTSSASVPYLLNTLHSSSSSGSSHHSTDPPTSGFILGSPGSSYHTADSSSPSTGFTIGSPGSSPDLNRSKRLQSLLYRGSSLPALPAGRPRKKYRLEEGPRKRYRIKTPPIPEWVSPDHPAFTHKPDRRLNPNSGLHNDLTRLSLRSLQEDQGINKPSFPVGSIYDHCPGCYSTLPPDGPNPLPVHPARITNAPPIASIPVPRVDLPEPVAGGDPHIPYSPDPSRISHIPMSTVNVGRAHAEPASILTLPDQSALSQRSSGSSQGPATPAQFIKNLDLSNASSSNGGIQARGNCLRCRPVAPPYDSTSPPTPLPIWTVTMGPMHSEPVSAHDSQEQPHSPQPSSTQSPAPETPNNDGMTVLPSTHALAPDDLATPERRVRFSDIDQELPSPRTKPARSFEHRKRTVFTFRNIPIDQLPDHSGEYPSRAGVYTPPNTPARNTHFEPWVSPHGETLHGRTGSFRGQRDRRMVGAESSNRSGPRKPVTVMRCNGAGPSSDRCINTCKCSARGTLECPDIQNICEKICHCTVNGRDMHTDSGHLVYDRH